MPKPVAPAYGEDVRLRDLRPVSPERTVAIAQRIVATSQAKIQAMPVTKLHPHSGMVYEVTKGAKQSESSPTPRKLLSAGDDTQGAHSLSLIEGGSFDAPLFESRSALEHSACPADDLASFVDAIALQAATRAVRKVEGGKLRKGHEGATVAHGAYFYRDNAGQLHGAQAVATVGAEWQGGRNQSRGRVSCFRRVQRRSFA
jgi:hypothetical protein